MRETSRGGALVSAVVAVLEKQQNETGLKKSELFKTKFENPLKERDNATKTKYQSQLKPTCNGFNYKIDEGESPENSDTSKSVSPPSATYQCDLSNPKIKCDRQIVNKCQIRDDRNEDESVITSNTGVIIREFIYKDDLNGYNNVTTENTTPFSGHPLLFVQQKDPKLVKNTSYVIVKDNELNKKRSDENVVDSCFQKCSPTNRLNTSTKNKPHYTQTVQETNSGRQFATTIQTRANILKTTKNTETLAEKNLQTAADRNFETAIKNFDRTAEDVQNYVLKGKTDTEECNSVVFRNKQFDGDQKERFSSTTDYTSNVSDEFDSSSSDDTTSDSEQGDELINEGLETITEEDRTAGSSFKSTVGERTLLNPHLL